MTQLAHPPPTFQALIFELQRYWSDQGCVIMQSYDMEMGAGTFHPATFLRAIGPEPWVRSLMEAARGLFQPSTSPRRELGPGAKIRLRPRNQQLRARPQRY